MPGSTNSTTKRANPARSLTPAAGPTGGASCSTWPSSRAPLAAEAVRRIDAIFDVERTISGLPMEQRLVMRQKDVAPLVAELEAWMRAARSKMSRHADVAKAMDYMLKRWDTFSRFLSDGRICLTTDGVEKCVFRDKSAWDSDLMSAGDPDLKSAISN